MTQGVHRTTADSKAGRKMSQAKGARIVGMPVALTAEQITWNAEVERRKAEKKASRA